MNILCKSTILLTQSIYYSQCNLISYLQHFGRIRQVMQSTFIMSEIYFASIKLQYFNKDVSKIKRNAYTTAAASYIKISANKK